MQLACLDVFLALAAVFLLCAWLTLKCGLPASLAPLCVLASISTGLTFAGMAGVLVPAAAMVYLGGAVLGVWAMFSEKRAGRAMLSRLLSPGAAAFWLLTLSFTAYFALRQPRFFEFDEFSLWGTAAKMTSIQNVIYTEGKIGWPWQGTQNAGLMMLSYFIQFFGSFAAWKTYAAYAALLFSCFAVVLCGLEWKDYPLAVPATAACWLLPYVLTVYASGLYLVRIYMTSYGDIPAGIVFGAVVAYWIGLRRQCGGRLFWPVLPVLSLCANIKSNTVVLGLAAAGILAAEIVLFPQEAPWKKGLLRRIGRAAAAMAVPLAMFLGWGRYTAALAIRNAESGGMGQTDEGVVAVAVNGIKMLLGLPVGEYYQLRAARYEKAFRDVGSAFLHTHIGMGHSSAVDVAVILAIFLLVMLLQKTARERLNTAVLWLLSAGCFAAYLFMLVLSYAFIFKEVQAEQLVDFNRYLYAYTLGWFLLALALLCAAAKNGRWPLLGKGAVMGICLVFLVAFCRYVSPRRSVLGYDTVAEFCEMDAISRQTACAVEAIREDPARQGAPEDQRVFLVRQGDNGFYWFRYSYEFLPLVLDYSGRMATDDGRYGAGGGSFGVPGEDGASDGYYAYTPAEFLDTVQECGCQYLLVAYVDDLFYEGYGSLFDDGLAHTRMGGVLYRVEETGFVLVAEVGAV